MATEAEGIARGSQVGRVTAAVRIMATHAAQFLAGRRIGDAAGGVEAMREISVAAFADSVAGLFEEGAITAPVGLMAGCALLGQLLGVLGAVKTEGLRLMAIAAELAGRGF